jgi:diguanylate cyclase (GGDEF)-like protein
MGYPESLREQHYRVDFDPDEAAADLKGQHVSGFYTLILLSVLRSKLPAQAVQDVLIRAGETRSLVELDVVSSWSSYGQFRRLLEEAVRTLGAARQNLTSALATITHADDDMAQIIQGLGSPREVFISGAGTNPLLPIRRYEMTEVGEREWTIREWFLEGFEPYDEFCGFVAGQYSQIPMFFGLPAAEVVEQECQCRGDAACLFRIRWGQVDDAVMRADYFEVHSKVLEARLEQLQAMVTDLASNERYEDVLQGIVASSVRAVGAAGVVLALKPRIGSSRKVYSEGLSETDGASIAEDLLEGTGREGVIAVQVESVRRHYGVLAVDERGGVFTTQTQGTLETYARLAAATLDAADAMEDARHQANTAGALLDLSTSLAEILSTEDMAARVARAVPQVIDCDRVALFLDDGDWTGGNGGELRLAAAHGYPDAAVALLSTRPITEAQLRTMREDGIEYTLVSDVGTAAAVAVPISLAGNTIGCIVAGVTENPERLAITSRLSDRLKGLAAQASIAIGNARLVEQIRFQSVHDALTGLPNRALILDRTEQMLARARRTQVAVAALFIDLDGFKEVNDTLGHGFGDQLLQAVATRLSLTMRESDSIGRLGGDEFIVLVDGTTMDAGPELVAERLLTVLREPFTIEALPNGPLTLTASIGIAAGIRPSPTELLRDADIALYQAKAAGRDCFVVFRPQMHTAVQGRLLLEMDLRDAIAQDQFFLVYQPIFDLASRETNGVEALLRWRHPVRGVVQPDEFIPILEGSGMITEVGRWVLEEACRQGARWHAQGYDLDVSVNVSARQLETSGLIEEVARALEESGFDAHSLIVEITETAIMKNMDAVVPRLAALKATGVRVAIDDFGTGYSSLAYLQHFPVDTLKIDRSFISTMADSPESGALIHTLVQLGKSLGLQTLAEGIEESAQYSQLEREHCDSGQGYIFARPLEADAVETFLLARSSRGGSADESTKAVAPA